MYMLYGSLLFMLSLAVSFILLPFVLRQAVCSKLFFLSTLFVVGLSITLYHFSGDKVALHRWLAQGKHHYQLQQKVAELGGIDAIIFKIKNKLALHPDDAQGWFILGKLYLANHQPAEAEAALRKARQLAPMELR